MEQAIEELSKVAGRIYVHVDIDVLDPNEIRATQLPVPGGLGLAESASSLRVVRQTGKLCGLAVMVFNAHKDPHGREAAKLNKLIVESLHV